MEPNLAGSVGKDLTATCGRPAFAAEHAMKTHGGAALLCWQTLADLFSGLSILVRDRRGQGQETRSSGGSQCQCRHSNPASRRRPAVRAN